MGIREETPGAQEQANDQPFPPPPSEQEREETERNGDGDHHYDLPPCGGDAPGLGASAQKKPCPRKFLGAQAEGLYAMPATAQQNATATSTNATYVVAEVANDTIALRSEGCYDITVHKCACDADLTEDACTDMGRIWTVHCECHLEELAGTQTRRVLLQFEDAPMMNDTAPMMNDTMTNMTMDANATEPAGDEVAAEDEEPEEEEAAPEPAPVSVDISFPDAPPSSANVANTL